MSRSLPPLPSLGQQYEQLVGDGLQFSGAEREASRFPLPGVYFDDGPALYDARIVSDIPLMIAPDPVIHQALAMERRNPTVRDAGPFVYERFTSAGIIIGFSGYGSPGYSYPVEAAAIQAVHEAARLPIDAVVDGGTGYGVPGLSGVIAEAQEEPVPTIGVVPIRGLRGISPRRVGVVAGGPNFGDEAPAIGLLADVLVVMGGEDNTEKELRAALAGGSLALLADIKTYERPGAVINQLPHYLEHDEQIQRAAAEGHLFVCQGIDGLATAIAGLDRDQLHETRVGRSIQLFRFSHPSPGEVFSE